MSLLFIFGAPTDTLTEYALRCAFFAIHPELQDQAYKDCHQLHIFRSLEEVDDYIRVYKESRMRVPTKNTAISLSEVTSQFPNDGEIISRGSA